MRTGLRTLELLRILLVASIVVPLLLLVAIGWLTYRAAFADARSEAAGMSEVAREHASKVFDSFRLVADRVEESLEGLDASAIASSEKSLHDEFVRLVRNLPQVQNFIVIGRDGHLQVATAVYPVDKKQDFSDRDYFVALKTSGVETFFSRVQVSRVTGETFFGWGEARRGADGAFEGVVDIAISPEFFMRFYRTLIDEVAPSVGGRVVSIVRDDGEILVRYPPIPGNAPPVPSGGPFFAAIHANPDSGSYVSRSVIVPTAERLYAYRKVPGHPIYIVAGRTIGAIVTEWFDAMLIYASIACVGSGVFFWVTLTTLRGFQREQIALARLSEEMARRQEAEEQLRQSQKMEAVGQLTGGIAHDFNNLLTVIRSSVDLLLRPGLPDDRRRRYLEAISETTTRATRLTSQLLAFARRQPLKPEAFDVVESLKEVLEMIRPLTGSRISIETRLPLAPLRIHVDRSQFDTAIVNLALNARDAMASEGQMIVEARAVSEIPPLRARASILGEYVAVAVGDKGVGIPAEMFERIFEPFFTTKSVGQGTGLGLSQVFGFVKQSGGEVAVESERGRGSTFTLYLPRAVGVEPKAEPDRPAGARPRALDACVLVVEDNDEVGAFVVDSLTELGCATVRASDAQQALRELTKDASRFDVVFSDVAMPGMDGIELAAEIKRRNWDVPIVLTSGYSQVLAQCHPDGLELLQKPYAIDDLARVLGRAIANSRRAARVGVVKIEPSEVRMRVQIEKWGNSAAVRIPASVMRAASLSIDQAVEVCEEGGRIVIEPAREAAYDLDAFL